jgi:uncharacterized protein YndB with AHSA1/START domain
LLRLEASSDLSLAWQIDAPGARVWHCITDADVLSQWLGRLVDGAVDAGSDFVVDHGDNYLCRSTVLACIEPSRLAFTWGFPDEPESEVVLELGESADSTEVRLTHSALGDLTTSYRDGWCVHLSYLEAAALATPLPTSMFWRLHGTIAQLNAR